MQLNIPMVRSGWKIIIQLKWRDNSSPARHFLSLISGALSLPYPPEKEPAMADCTLHRVCIQRTRRLQSQPFSLEWSISMFHSKQNAFLIYSYSLKAKVKGEGCVNTADAHPFTGRWGLLLTALPWQGSAMSCHGNHVPKRKREDGVSNSLSLPYLSWRNLEAAQQKTH